MLVKKELSRDQFKDIAQKAFADAKISRVEINESQFEYSRFDNRVHVPVRFTYNTQYLGEFSEEKIIELIKEKEL